MVIVQTQTALTYVQYNLISLRIVYTPIIDWVMNGCIEPTLGYAEL